MNELAQLTNQYGVCWVLIALLIQIVISVRLKNAVKHEYEIKEANLKAELQIANLRFQHIFSKQADAIVQTYQNLLPLLDVAEDYTGLIQSSETKEINAKLQALNLASSNLFTFYRPNKIYIPKATAKRLTLFLDTISSIITKHIMLESMTSLHSQFTGEKTEKYGKEIDELKTTVTPLLLELENDFQKVLGVYTEEEKR
jgi:hypothetical protein